MSDFLGLLLVRTARQSSTGPEPQRGLRLRPLSRFEAAMAEPTAAFTLAPLMAEPYPWRQAAKAEPESVTAAPQRQPADGVTVAAAAPWPQPPPATVAGPRPQIMPPVASAQPAVLPLPTSEQPRSPLLAASALIAPLPIHSGLAPERQLALRPRQGDASEATPTSADLRPQAAAPQPASQAELRHSPPSEPLQLAPLQAVWVNAPQPLSLPPQTPATPVAEAAPVAAAPVINISIGSIELADRRWPATPVASTPPQAKAQGLDVYLDSRSRHGRGGRA